jgi:4-aminobutyrate aminotransferase
MLLVLIVLLLIIMIKNIKYYFNLFYLKIINIFNLFMNILNHIPKSISKLHHNILPIGAKGSYIFTESDKYLDLTSGIGALSTGHNHPRVVEKVKFQLDNYVHMPQQIFKSHPIQIELTKKLLNIMPTKKLDNFFYVSTGSEATDNAIKIARSYTTKSNIISINGGFHGRTLGALSVTSSNLNCKRGISPLLSNTYFCSDFTKESLDTLLTFQSAPEDTAAIIFESVQGEGGVKSINADFLKYVEKICNENNIMLIADEVQCGSMRTGSWWNFTQKDIEPHIITFAKGIASGYPIAGVAASSEIMNSLPLGLLGGTYGGNAISSAAASATIDILNDPILQQNVNEYGNYINDSLKDINLIKEIRQYGLMIGIEFNDNNITTDIVSKLRDRNILVLTAGNQNQYIRLLPPLNIEKKDIDIFLEHFTNIINNYYVE